jgi:signal transduction histidine kinase
LFEESKKVLKKEDFNTYLVVRINEARLNYLQKKYDKAIEICKKTIKEAKEHRYYDIVQHSYVILALVYSDKNDIQKAIYYCDTLNNLCKRYKNPSLEKWSLFNLSELYQKSKNYKLACKYQNEYIKINDSIYKVETEKRINNLKLKYNLQKKVTENKLLMAKNRMKDEKIKRQKTNNIILTGLIISGIIIFLLLLYSFRNAKKTNRKLELLNKQLLENERELHLLNNTQKNLFAIISHDLRGPIGTAKSFFDILNNESLEISEEDRNNYIKTVGRTISSTYELLENVLFWSKHLLSNNEMENEDFYPFAVVNDILSNINSTLFTKEIVFRNLIDSNIKINSCPSVFKVVMRNLITNAIKFTHRKGEIIINMTQNEKDYIFSVKDNGIGIDTEKLDILFTTNIKQSTPGTENEKGSGLGLMISRELIKRMGGDIYAESEKNKGTTFYFTIPIKSKK